MPPALLDHPTKFMTLEEYVEQDHGDRWTELVRGYVVEYPFRLPANGYVCGKVSSELRNFVRPRKLGRLVLNCGLITERDPDTLRGMDVAYYSYDIVPPGEPPEDYGPTPKMIVEVRSPGDRRGGVLAKVDEYFAAGAKVVCIVHAPRRTLEVHTADYKPRVLGIDDVWTLPELFPDFSTPVRNLFE